MRFTKLVAAAFTEVCPACGGLSAAGFCDACAAAWPRVTHPCAICGLARPVRKCPRAPGGWRLAAVIAPLSYGAPLDHYVHALKYRGARALGRALALPLAAAARPAAADVDALVPVPLHPRRLRERGYNQATEIARTLATELGLPVLQGGIRRRAPSASQTTQHAGARRAAMAAAFSAQRELPGVRLAIVDDVLTTGATANALAAALLAAGAASCAAWAVARTPERRGGG